jgi:hypothetical protein
VKTEGTKEYMYHALHFTHLRSVLKSPNSEASAGEELQKGTLFRKYIQSAKESIKKGAGRFGHYHPYNKDAFNRVSDVTRHTLAPLDVQYSIPFNQKPTIEARFLQEKYISRFPCCTHIGCPVPL